MGREREPLDRDCGLDRNWKADSEPFSKCSERREFVSNRSTGTGVYIPIHEDSEHRMDTKYRAQ